MQWDDISDDTWTIVSAEREKGNAGSLRLPPLVLDIIQDQPRIAGNPYVFAGRGSGPFNSFAQRTDELDAKLSKMAPWVIHDLRRTARSLMSREGVQRDHAERVLGHAIPGVEGVYDRHSYIRRLSLILAFVLASPALADPLPGDFSTRAPRRRQMSLFPREQRSGHRVAAHRKRQRPLPLTRWYGQTPKLSLTSRSFNVDGTRYPTPNWGSACVRSLDATMTATPRLAAASTTSRCRTVTSVPIWAICRKRSEAAMPPMTGSPSILGKLRMTGDLGWDEVLDLTRELDQWQTYGSPREARAKLRRRYEEDRWLGQPYYPVLIVEKDTLEPVCKPMAARWQMPFASSRGYSSLTLQHDVAKMLIRRHAQTGQDAIV